MKKRKKYIVDRRFQLRTAFSIVGAAAVVSLIIIGVISANILYNNDKLTNIYEIEKNIFQLMQDSSMSGSISEPVDMVSMLSKNHERNLYNISKIISYNKLLIVSLVICVIIQGVLLFVMIIKITHRISGPVYVMSNYMKDIIDGKFPSPRALRDRDELKDFYNLFTEMIETLKKKVKQF